MNDVVPIAIDADRMVRLITLGVEIRKKRSALWWRVVMFFSETHKTWAWVTWRWPFQSKITIWLPDGIDAVTEKHVGIIDHELVHCEQIRPWWGPFWSGLLVFLIPLPVFFSGRWFAERQAYLQDIRRGRYTIDQAVETLWGKYGWPWPRCLMRRWLEEQLTDAPNPP